MGWLWVAGGGCGWLWDGWEWLWGGWHSCRVAVDGCKVVVGSCGVVIGWLWDGCEYLRVAVGCVPSFPPPCQCWPEEQRAKAGAVPLQSFQLSINY